MISDKDKPAAYDRVAKEMEAHKDDDYRVSYKLPCMGKFCQSSVYCTEDWELNNAREGRMLCEYCSESGVSRELNRFNQLCPAAFRHGDFATDANKLPCPEALKALKRWGKNFGSSSLWLYGNTGTGKSRMMFLILQHCILAKGYTFDVLRGGEFRQRMLEAYSEGSGKANVVKEKLTRVNLLVFDDFGQDALTETMLTDLWQVLDKRFGQADPTAFLSNFAPADLRERYAGFFALDSMIRRIEEFSTFILAQKL